MIPTIRDIKGKLTGKTVLLRVDFNVHVKGGKIADDFRMRMTLPTIQYLLGRGAKVVILSHLGRPKAMDSRLSLKPVAQHLAQLLKKRIFFAEGSPEDSFFVPRFLAPKSILMLENVRFRPGEEKNDQKFAKTLAKLGDLYVNDAFAVSHRAAASLVAITKYLPSFAGFLLEREVENLDRVLAAKLRPFGVILGGAKMQDKLQLLEKFLKKADWVFVGGGIANTLLWARGLKIGKSIKDTKHRKEAKRFLQNKKLILPVDWLSAQTPKSKVSTYHFSKGIAKNEMILDIGFGSTLLVEDKIKESRTILWNGPVGYFENPGFDDGSYEIARAIAANKRAFAVVGGGDTVAAFRAANSKFKIQNSKLFLSTGGGAMIEYLAGKKLPGIEALR